MNGIVGGKLQRSALFCRVCFFLATMRKGCWPIFWCFQGSANVAARHCKWYSACLS